MKFVLILIITLFPALLMGQNDFPEKQLSFSRVHQAFQISDLALQKLFKGKSLQFPSKQIYLRAFKQEQLLELWATDDVQFQFIKSYSFTANSGLIGPKQKEGDKQIPEGFYHLEKFNPESRFFLSFKINYPNTADSIRNKNEQNFGSDIYIHGGNQTLGCIPLGDENIAELYWLCLNSYSANPDIPIHIFPCKMDERLVSKINKSNPEYIAFWESILPMYRFFQSHKLLGEVTGYDVNGNYQLAIPWD